MTDDLSTGSPAPAPALAVRRLDRYTKDELAQILGDGDDPFGVADTGLTWLPKEEHFGLAQNGGRNGGRLVAHAGLRRLPLEVRGVGLEVVGVGGVVVAPGLRGQGLARQVVGAALEHARTMGPQWALLFCRPPLVALYEKLGWRAVDGEVHVEQPQERLVLMPLRTMWTPLHGDESWPEGAVRLRSLPM
ncbi:GNAT family N-acetyltransferase [Streptomyces sp. NPDC048442]|uniref:GNAT family N-acetyltransferase n=1 Tax=Streptomyces sp. NPDC048442 TaxID=3154823 RepID=UPI00341DDEE4